MTGKADGPAIRCGLPRNSGHMIGEVPRERNRDSDFVLSIDQRSTGVVIERFLTGGARQHRGTDERRRVFMRRREEWWAGAELNFGNQMRAPPGSGPALALLSPAGSACWATRPAASP